VVAPHFIAGLEYDQALRRVVRAAPILKFAVGWPATTCETYFSRKGWAWEILK
jgi:hypothetical protein